MANKMKLFISTCKKYSTKKVSMKVPVAVALLGVLIASLVAIPLIFAESQVKTTILEKRLSDEREESESKIKELEDELVVVKEQLQTKSDRLDVRVQDVKDRNATIKDLEGALKDQEMVVDNMMELQEKTEEYVSEIEEELELIKENFELYRTAVSSSGVSTPTEENNDSN